MKPTTASSITPSTNPSATSTPSTTSRANSRPNGIFNVDEVLLDSSLGEDFLSLFAAPRNSSAGASGRKY